MEHTAAAPSRARGYQSGTSRHIERADPEMVRRGLRVSAAPDPRDRPVAIRLSTGIFSARAASPLPTPARPPRLSGRPQRTRGVAVGHLETGPTAPDRPRPTPAPPRARRLASRTRRAHLPPFPSPPSQAAPAPSRAREQTPWSVTRGVVAGVAFGALVIAGGALVAGGPTPTAESAILARLGSSRKPDGPTEETSSAFFSLPSFERDQLV